MIERRLLLGRWGGGDLLGLNQGWGRVYSGAGGWMGKVGSLEVGKGLRAGLVVGGKAVGWMECWGKGF